VIDPFLWRHGLNLDIGGHSGRGGGGWVVGGWKWGRRKRGGGGRD